MVHVPFGVVLIGGTRAKTRTGSVVLLQDVLDEAVEKVSGLIREKNPDLPDLAATAQAVGVGAVVFNDLKNRRQNDIELDLDDDPVVRGQDGPLRHVQPRPSVLDPQAPRRAPPAAPGRPRARTWATPPSTRWSV